VDRAYLGEFEELTLLAVKAIGEPTYGVPVQQYVERAAGRAVSMGAVYATLARLEAKGLLRSMHGEPTPTRGGKRKRLYDVTTEGMRALRDMKKVRDRLWRVIDVSARS
jgi:DNA-binding PadR family transcriptional regulator